MNRITPYLPDSEHPLEAPPMIARQRVLRALCLILIAFVLILTAGVISTVYFALGGKPLSGNAGRLVGVPIITVVGATLTLSAVTIARFITPIVWTRGINRVATEPPDAPEEGATLETEPERLWRVYAGGKFAEYAIAEAAAVATAVLYHLTADPVMIGFVAGVIAFLLLRLPTAARNREWYDDATAKLEELRLAPQ